MGALFVRCLSFGSGLLTYFFLQPKLTRNVVYRYCPERLVYILPVEVAHLAIGNT